MSVEVLVALIGAAGVIIAAWITRSRRKIKEEEARADIVGRDKIGGDMVGRDKIETHDHIYIEEDAAERKSAFVYFLEKISAFIFTLIIAGLIFGGIGMLIAKEIGGVIGAVLALILAVVNAGNVRRTKGII